MKQETLIKILWVCVVISMVAWYLAPVKKENKRDYQIEVTNDSTQIWDGERLVGIIPYDSTSKFDKLIIKDNE